LLALDNNPAPRNVLEAAGLVRQEQFVKPGFSQDETMPTVLIQKNYIATQSEGMGWETLAKVR